MHEEWRIISSGIVDNNYKYHIDKASPPVHMNR